MAWIPGLLGLALVALSGAAPALAQESPEPRLFATVGLGPAGETAVRAGSRELAGAAASGLGLGVRGDLPLHRNFRIGVDVDLVFDANYALRPYADQDLGGAH